MSCSLSPGIHFFLKILVLNIVVNTIVKELVIYRGLSLLFFLILVLNIVVNTIAKKIVTYSGLSPGMF